MKKLLLTAAAFLLATTTSAYADGDNKVMKGAKIKREEAKAIALKEVPGDVIDQDIEKRKSGLFWYVTIKPSDGKNLKKLVKVDANSGKVVEVKVDDDDDDDKKRD
ncbi:MAG TPA: PepSY domain-containing protein [Candidatus Obscuribacterales bacterium]